MVEFLRLTFCGFRTGACLVPRRHFKFSRPSASRFSPLLDRLGRGAHAPSLNLMGWTPPPDGTSVPETATAPKAKDGGRKSG